MLAFTDSARLPRGHNLDRYADDLAAQLATLADDYLLTPQQVARHLHVSVRWLEVGRSKQGNYGPPFIKITARTTRYPAGGLRNWLLERARSF